MAYEQDVLTPTPSELTQLIQEFLDGMTFWNLPKLKRTNRELEALMRAQLVTRNINSPHLERTLEMFASFAEHMYPTYTLTEKSIPAILVWYLVYVEDILVTNAPVVTSFQHRFIQGLPQLDPVLDALADLLRSIYDVYDYSCANFLIRAVFDFMTVTCTEQALEAFISRHDATTRFPWFLRSLTAASIPFAIALFPKSQNVDFAVVLRALPDMDFFISATNDLLSFYKEQFSGEPLSYVFHRAGAESKSRTQVLAEIKRELLSTSRSIEQVLSTTGNVRAVANWKHFERGYIAWHFEHDRYRLKELGFGRLSGHCGSTPAVVNVPIPKSLAVKSAPLPDAFKSFAGALPYMFIFAIIASLLNLPAPYPNDRLRLIKY